MNWMDALNANLAADGVQHKTTNTVAAYLRDLGFIVRIRGINGHVYHISGMYLPGGGPLALAPDVGGDPPVIGEEAPETYLPEELVDLLNLHFGPGFFREE